MRLRCGAADLARSLRSLYLDMAAAFLVARRRDFRARVHDARDAHVGPGGRPRRGAVQVAASTAGDDDVPANCSLPARGPNAAMRAASGVVLHALRRVTIWYSLSLLPRPADGAEMPFPPLVACLSTIACRGGRATRSRRTGSAPSAPTSGAPPAATFPQPSDRCRRGAASSSGSSGCCLGSRQRERRRSRGCLLLSAPLALLHEVGRPSEA